MTETIEPATEGIGAGSEVPNPIDEMNSETHINDRTPAVENQAGQGTIPDACVRQSSLPLRPSLSPPDASYFPGKDFAPVPTPAEIAREGFHHFLDSLLWDGDSRNHNKANRGFLKAACLAIDPDIAFEAIEMRIRKAGGIIDWRDLDEQRRRAYNFVRGGGAGELPPKPKVARLEFSPEKLRQAASLVKIPEPEQFLRRVSKVPPATVTATSFLEAIYRPGERIVVFDKFKSQGQVVYHVGQSLPTSVPTTGPKGVWFLVQPVDGEEHFNPRQDKVSRRSEESVTRWPFLVLESDKADTNDWLRLLVQLPLALVAIYTSGGRSIHALVRVNADDKEEWDTIKASVASVLVPLGADAGALSAVRLSRLPQCRRGEKTQELLYLNPGADGTPIHGLEEGKADIQ